MRVAPCPAEAKRKRGYKFDRSREFIMVQDYKWEQGACPDTACSTNLSYVQERKLRIRQLAETKSRPGGTKTLSDWHQPGRRDKPINYTVRVICSGILYIFKFSDLGKDLYQKIFHPYRMSTIYY